MPRNSQRTIGDFPDVSRTLFSSLFSLWYMSKAIIETEGVAITYNEGKSNEFKALRNMSVEIMAREYIIFFGPSGCGKSTLLYSIFGVLPPSMGKVYVKGDSVYDYEPMELVEFQRHTMGIMYQQFNLIASITVLDNVALPLIFAGIPPAKRERRAMELLERFGIAHVAHKRPTDLSGGQQQRVSVARSLVSDPEILIADEPVGNLDSISSKAVMDTLDEINERDRKTILLVTHDAKHLPYAHRVFYLKDGRMDRIVANPEKKQVLKTRPGTSIVTELEQAQRIYPYDSPEMIRVKSLVNYLTQDLSFDQISRLEEILEYSLQGKLSFQTSQELLKKPTSEHGVGLRPELADKIGSRLERVLIQSHDIIRFRKTMEDQKADTDLNQDDIVDRLAVYMVQEFKVELSQEQFKCLRTSVDMRVSGYIDKDEIKRQLELDRTKGGAGLDAYVVDEVSRHLEKLIAQGIAELKVQQKQEHDRLILEAEKSADAERKEQEQKVAEAARRKSLPFWKRFAKH